jgi:hypothetical protein
MRRFAIDVLLATTVLVACPVQAHGTRERVAPSEDLRGIERGVAFALDCDAAIHEVLYEYDFCIRSNVEKTAGDAEAATAYWWIATLRAESARDNGYPDANVYLPRYRKSWLDARVQAPVPHERLCAAIHVPCSTLSADLVPIDKE